MIISRQRSKCYEACSVGTERFSAKLQRHSLSCMGIENRQKKGGIGGFWHVVNNRRWSTSTVHTVIFHQMAQHKLFGSNQPYKWSTYAVRGGRVCHYAHWGDSVGDPTAVSCHQCFRSDRTWPDSRLVATPGQPIRLAVTGSLKILRYCTLIQFVCFEQTEGTPVLCEPYHRSCEKWQCLRTKCCFRSRNLRKVGEHNSLSGWSCTWLFAQQFKLSVMPPWVLMQQKCMQHK